MGKYKQKTDKFYSRYKLILRDVKLPVYLGLYDCEQFKRDTIVIDIDIMFCKIPGGCKSDNLENVVC